MTPAVPARIVSVMAGDRISGFTVHEFRLYADVDRGIAQARVEHDEGAELSIPLLARIDDARSLVLVRPRHVGDPPAAADPVCATIGGVGGELRSRDFRTRVALAAADPGSHFRLALIDSGRNDAAPSVARAWVAASVQDRPDADSQLLWIGMTADSTKGLFVLVGHDRAPNAADDPSGRWPLSFSADLGVRIYAGMRA